MESDKSFTAPSDSHCEGVVAIQSDGVVDLQSEGVLALHSEGVVSAQRIRPLHGRTSGPARRSTKGQWTAEEDEILRNAVQRYKGKNWKKIAEYFKDRTDVQCLHRWQKVLNPELIKGPWSKEEDETIVELVNRFGPKKWSTIAQHLPGRIGKQCRERWHNHLNPSINKEAWTQQEELALIRAHQIYGNRWAELTKYLPGRTDNSIKNHWNSSVKKKLDSYLASGLLEQFQGLPLVPYHSPVPLAIVHSSGEDSSLKCGIEAEEISECSQESIVAGCSQSMSSLGNAVLDTIEEFHLTEESGLGNEQSSSPASCSEQYFTSMRDVNFSMTELPCEIACSSNFLQQNFSNNAITPATSDFQYNNAQVLPNTSSSEQVRDSSRLRAHCIAPNEDHELVNVAFQSSSGFRVPTAIGNISAHSAKPDNLFISDDECCQYLFSEAMNVDASNYQSSNNQISETEKASQSINSSRYGVLATSCRQPLPSGPSPLSVDDTRKCTFKAHEHEYIASAHDDFIYTNGTASSPCDDGTANANACEQHYLKESSKFVPVNSFTTGADTARFCTVDEVRNAKDETQDAGALCYEPPRFPSLDIPFLSCDLIQSGSDIQQEYSPLGIRQLMMSSMGCITPFRLWDSPSRDDSPDAVLKTAAKTFTGTPSILKKRNRDLLSPLSDRRVDKKLEIDMTFSLAKEFSRLDVMLVESETQKTSLMSPSDQKSNLGSSYEDKENMDPALESGQEKARDCAISKKERGSSISEENTKQGTVEGSKTEASAQIPSGVHVEERTNDRLFFSPEANFKMDRAFAPSSRTPKNLCRRILGTLSEHGISSDTFSGNSCIIISSPSISKKNHENHLLAASTVQSSGRSSDTVVENSVAENLTIFGESPSAWKSPWFINSFKPGPKVDTDISIEDIGYFMSPGDRSYDALALMKHFSEHNASAYADALEVMGNDTPETLQRRRSAFQNMDQEKNNAQPENLSNFASNVPTECRTLDFSECGTPGKATERGKSSNAVSFSSPSYLLKGCR